LISCANNGMKTSAEDGSAVLQRTQKKQQFRLFKLGRALRLINPCQNSTVAQRSLAKAAVFSAYVMLIVEIVSWL